MADPAELDPDGVARREFTTAFRGFDQVEVRAYLSSLSMKLREVLDRERDMQRRVDEAEQRASEADNLDEHHLTTLLGEETARIFEAAREAAAEIRSKAEAKTAQLVREAQDDASRMTSEAAELLRLRTTEAETAAASLLSEAEARRDRIVADAAADAEARRVEAAADAEAMRAAAERVLEHAQAEAEAAVEASRQQGREMVAEAQIVRERILKDLARRRRAGKAQLEQVRAARERLLDAYALVRRTLEEATTELTVAVPEAKLAAEAAGRRVELDDDELSVEAIEAELDAGRVAGVPLLDTGEIPVTRADEAAPAPAPGPEEVGAEAEVAPVATLTLVDDLPDEADIEVEAVDDVAGERGDEAVDDEGADEGGRVEDLFARIRSEVPEIEETDAASDSDLEAAEDADARPEASGSVDEPDEGDHDESVLERRDRYLIGLESDLARVLKRQLADDENDKLDLIRRRPAKAVATELLPSLDEHRTAFVDAVTVTLGLAARSGGEFALDLLDPERDAVAEPPDLGVDVDDLAVELAESLLVPIRERVSELAVDTDADDALDGVRACYRRWKGNAGELAAQYVHTAFNRGVYEAVPDGEVVRWVVDPGAGPCPDGEDDALEGPVPKGTPFPTGHLHPPAHPGCRCLLVPGLL
jgi:cell division septum initiation protein DivIVA